ncbi:MAG: hypothetical protein ISS81_02790 [Candidatus Marinimicrobia bacterium]|nr:hypothetical protein [Candidatus Neomarinimicrobiota bacterium]
MKDTDFVIEERFREMMMRKSGEERMLMGFSMYETAKQFVVSSIKNNNPNISLSELRQEIFLRFYGNDFNKINKEKVIIYLNQRFTGEIY